MGVVSEKRLDMIRGLAKALPQSSLRSLELALGLTKDEALIQVRELISVELEFRHVKEAVFAPFLPMFQPRADGLRGVTFAPWVIDRIWTALERFEPELYKQSRYALRGLRTEDPTPVVFFRLVTAAGQLIRQCPEEILPAKASQEDGVVLAEFANYLDLHRISRHALAKLPSLMGRIDAEKAAAMRLMFGDACAIDVEGGYRLLELLFANLEDGSQIVKFVATVSDRPNDRFLAQSELADFGTRILDHIEDNLKDLKLFMGNRHRQCADLGLASERVGQSLSQLQSFEHFIELAREGPWGKRVGEAHKLIAELVEAQLRGAERVIDDALPMKSERVYGRVKKETPRLDKPPSDEVVLRARQTLKFIKQVRNTATAGGFAALHSRTVQSIEGMLDSYFEELLSMANGEEPFDADTLMQFFEMVTDMMEALLGEEKAHTARRRVASSDLLKPSKNVA